MDYKEIIKEFREKCYKLWISPQKPYDTDKRVKAIQDFWLSKLQAHNQDLLKKIEELDTYAWSNFSGVHKNKAGLYIKLKDIKNLIK